MTSAAVSLVLGPADWLECDARMVPFTSAGIAPRAATMLNGSLRKSAQDAVRDLIRTSPDGKLAVALQPAAHGAPVTVLARIAELAGSSRDLQRRVDGALDASMATLKDAIPSERWRSFRPMRLVIPCPSTLGWFRPSAIEDGAIAVLVGARRIAKEHRVDVVMAVEDRALMRQLQLHRTSEAQRWWEVLDRDSFALLADAARTLSGERSAVFVGSGATGRNVYEGFDRRLRAVADRFGLTTRVPRGLGEGRYLLEALIEKCGEDESGARWKSLDRELRREFEDEVLGLGALLAVSLPVAWLGSLAPDGYTAAAADGIDAGPAVRELMGTYRDPASMSPAAAAAIGLPSLAEQIAAQVPAQPSLCVFIGVERDLATFDEVLEALDDAVPGFPSAAKLLLQHTQMWTDDRESKRSAPITSVTVADSPSFDDRARSFEQLLDAFVALAWARGEGNLQEFPDVASPVVLRWVSSSSRSVWATSAGLPGGGRR